MERFILFLKIERVWRQDNANHTEAMYMHWLLQQRAAALATRLPVTYPPAVHAREKATKTIVLPEGGGGYYNVTVILVKFMHMRIDGVERAKLGSGSNPKRVNVVDNQ